MRLTFSSTLLLLFANPSSGFGITSQTKLRNQVPRWGQIKCAKGANSGFFVTFGEPRLALCLRCKAG